MGTFVTFLVFPVRVTSLPNVAALMVQFADTVTVSFAGFHVLVNSDLGTGSSNRPYFTIRLEFISIFLWDSGSDE